MRPILISLIAVGLAIGATACGADGDPTQSFRTTEDDGWQEASLTQQGLADELVEQMMADIDDGTYTGISSILVARNGQIIIEKYFGEFDQQTLHSTRSASKAITSALVGIAIDQGFIESVGAKVLPYFPEYEGDVENWDERKRDVSIGHLLSMTSGVRGNEDNMYPTDDWIKFYLDQPLANPPGENVSYATSGVVTLGNIITRASDLRIPTFANRYLFEPLGIVAYKWPITNSRGSQGLAMTGGGLHLRPRDMSKFGQLFLNNGRWNGQQIISEEWVRASTSKQATSDLYGEDFGYLWRMIDRDIAGHKLRSYEAWGNGGQFILVFPSLDAVAVFTGENYGKFPEMEQPFELMDRYILPTLLSVK